MRLINGSIYQSMDNNSAGTNRRKMRNLMPQGYFFCKEEFLDFSEIINVSHN